MLNLKGLNKKIFLNASWLFGDKAISSILSAIQTVVIARFLGVESYGLLVLVIAYIDILNQFFDLRVWETATKYIGTFWENDEYDKTRSMIKLSYLLDITSGIIAFIIAISVAKLISTHIMHTPGAYTYIWIYSFSLFIATANSTSISILRVFNKFKNIALIRSFQAFFRLSIITILLILGFGIKGVLIGFVVTSFVGFFIRMWVVIKTLNEKNLGDWWKAKIMLIKDYFKDIAWFLGNTSFASTIRMGEERYLGIMVLGYFAGTEAVGLYKVAGSVAKLANFVIDPLYEAIYPELVKINSSNALKDIKTLVKDITKHVATIIVPITLIVIIFSEPIIKLVFGTDYLPASNALRIIAAAVVIARLTFWINPVLLAMERPGLRTILGLISTGSYIILLFILVPSFSFIGAAYAYLGFAVIKSISSVIIFRNVIEKK